MIASFADVRLYLFLLAQISTAFVGFSALIALVHEATGDGVSRLEGWITRVFVQLGFTVTAAAVAPIVSLLCGADQLWTWRACSGAVGAFVLTFCLSYPARRYAIAQRRAPAFVYLDLLLLTSAAALLLYVAMRPPANIAAWYAAGITAVLFVSGLGFLHALNSSGRAGHSRHPIRHAQTEGEA